MDRSLREEIALRLLQPYAATEIRNNESILDIDWREAGNLIWNAAGEVEAGFLEEGAQDPTP